MVPCYLNLPVHADCSEVETRGRTLEEMSALFGIESTLAKRSGMESGPKAGLVRHAEVAEGDDESQQD